MMNRSVMPNFIKKNKKRNEGELKIDNYVAFLIVKILDFLFIDFPFGFF